ncbi:DUF2752 domain-containing protein [Candidatus Enterococcus willemsii]|nr:DUF2752 domain-containing protein [Enterococcus sp. CU12B]
MCLFRWITGIPCPGCGMTRSFLHLLSGQIDEAFYYHPLFWLVPILFGIVLLRKQPIIQKVYASKAFWTAMLVVILGVYSYRMVQFFPHQVPLDFEEKALIPRILSNFL